jgi:hypothetical protein
MELDVKGGVRSLGLGLALTVCLAAQARAADVWATSTADSGPRSLRQAIADAAPGDTVRLGPELSFRTITLASQLVVDKDLTIDGTGAPEVSISGNDATRILDIGADGATCAIAVTLKELRIVHGNLPIGTFGAGVSTCAATLTIESVSFDANLAAERGSGLYQAGGNVVIRDSAFTGNSGIGGTALAAAGGTLALERVTISGNSGGTILHLSASTVTMTNVTVYGNSILLGATMSIWPGTTVTMRSSTVAANVTNGGLGTSYTISNSGTLEIGNSIIANAHNCHATTPPVDLGNNLEFGDLGPCGFPSADPQLGTLGLYGSSRVPTVPIAVASPARDAANNATCPAKDGSGKQRAVGVGNACDVGAFEYDGALTSTVTNLNDTGAGSLRQAIFDIGSGGTIDFQPGLSGVIAIDTPLVAHRAMSIDGPGHATLAIARNTSAGNFRLLETGSGPFCRDMAIAIKGLTFREGDANGANGGAIYNCANLSVEDARFTNNRGMLGSAVYTAGQSRLRLERVRIEDQANGSFGALYAGANVYHVVILDSSFDGASDNVQFDTVHAGLLRNVTIVSPDRTPVVTGGARTALEHVTLSGFAGVLSVGVSLGVVSLANSIVIGTNLGACVNNGTYESRYLRVARR